MCSWSCQEAELLEWSLKLCTFFFQMQQNEIFNVFTARRYTSAIYAVVMCPSVCPPVWSLYFFGFWRGGFLRPIPQCVLRQFGTSKIRVLPSETFSQTLDLENFATASRSRCQQNSSTFEISNGRRVACIYCTSANCNPITPSFRFVLDL